MIQGNGIDFITTDEVDEVEAILKEIEKPKPLWEDRAAMIAELLKHSMAEGGYARLLDVARVNEHLNVSPFTSFPMTFDDDKPKEDSFKWYSSMAPVVLNPKSSVILNSI